MIIDTALDRSIALGYGRLGLLVRSRLPGWPPDPPRIDGAAVLVTGAASGLGLAAAAGFARLGATVYAVARNPDRAAEAVREVRARVPEADVRPEACDLGSLREVRAFAEHFAAREPRLDALVNNAGVMPEKRTNSADEHELMFATHVLATLALSALLSGLLARSAPARIVTVSSGGMYGQGLDAGDPESERAAYGAKKLYARTKREQVVLTELLAERLRDRGIVVHAMHPGWVDTGGLSRSMPVFHRATRPILRTPEEGADTIVWLGAAPEPVLSSGLFWHDRRARPTHYAIGPRPEAEGDRERLWAYCESALGDAGIDAL